VERFRAWTDCDGHPESVLTRDELLDTVTLYWLTGTAASSARMYWESFKQVAKWFNQENTDTVPAPTGCCVFPKDLPRPSRRWPPWSRAGRRRSRSGSVAAHWPAARLWWLPFHDGSSGAGRSK
jgi:hypothetical protein